MHVVIESANLVRRVSSVLRAGAGARAVALLLGLMVAAASAQSDVCSADSRRPQLQQEGATQTVRSRGTGPALEIRLLRLSPQEWNLVLVDMRTMREMKAKRGSYTAPSYSLAELASLHAEDRILVSAGMTDSLYSPVPVGLLKIGGSVRNNANTASRTLDGLLCVGADRKMQLLSEMTPAGRRVPANWRAATATCSHAVQAGPMLLDQARPLIAARGPLSVSRVFAGVDRKGRLVIGHSPQATTFDLACTLAAPELVWAPA